MTEFRTTPTCRTHSVPGTRTAIRCKVCNTIILSIQRHDFVECDCVENPIFVDGGGDYLRIGGDPAKVETIPLKTGRQVRCKPDRILG